MIQCAQTHAVRVTPRNSNLHIFPRTLFWDGKGHSIPWVLREYKIKDREEEKGNVKKDHQILMISPKLLIGEIKTKQHIRRKKKKKSQA